MQFTSERVALRADGTPPTARLERQPALGAWHVPFSPILFDRDVEWREYSKSQTILIPTFGYRTRVNPAEAFGFMVQIGLRAATTCPAFRPQRIHLVYSDPVQQLTNHETGQVEYSIYLGLGFLTGG